MRTGHAEYAVKCFRHALEIKDDLQIHDYLSQALIRNEEFRPAMEQLAILAEAQPDNIQIVLTMARVAFLMEDYSAMTSACEKAMLIDKDNAEVAYLYGQAARGQGDLVNAVAMFTKAILLNEEYLDSYLQRGQVLLAQGDLEAAQEDADHLMEVASHSEDVLLLKARVLTAQAKLDDAISVYDRVVDGNPFCVAAYQERASLKLKTGDEKGAKEDLDKVSELAPENAVDENIEEKVKEAFSTFNPFA